MLELIFPVSLMLSAIFFISLSRNQKHYQQLIENLGEKFANKAIKYAKIGSFIVLFFSSLWILFIFAID